MTHRILIVEDDPLSRELLTDWLETEGYEVESVASLEAAFKVVKDDRPDMVLLDVRLGSEDGLALASWMRQQQELSQVPIVAVTAHAMVTEKDRIIQAGCNGVISKPVHFPSLQEQLRQCLAL